MRIAFKLLLGLSVVAGAIPATATTIAFTDLMTGMSVSPFVYPDVTFSSSTGQLYVGAAGGDHALCAYQRNSCAAALTITFAAPISSLRFFADGDDSAASSVFASGTGAVGGFSFSGGGFDGNVYTASSIDLSAYAGITSVTLTSDDPKGLGYDSFSFEPFEASGTVPEPASWTLMLTGFGLAGSAMRRRGRAMVAA